VKKKRGVDDSLLIGYLRKIIGRKRFNFEAMPNSPFVTFVHFSQAWLIGDRLYGRSRNSLQPLHLLEELSIRIVWSQ
jgi:hypothetical protein